MGNILDIQGNSIEEHELKFVPYNAKARQLTSGTFLSENLIYLGETSFGIRSVSQDVEEYASVPQSETIFNLPLTPWPIKFGCNVITSELIAYARDSEIYRYLPKNSVTLPTSLLDKAIAKYYPEEFDEYRKALHQKSGLMLTDTHLIRTMVQKIYSTFYIYIKNGAIPAQAEIDIEDYILCTIVQIVLMNSVKKIRVNNQKRWITKAIEIINYQPNQHYSVSELAETCGTSPRSLQASFKKHLGITPKKYLTNSRLKNIRQRILTDIHPKISHIAEEHGVIHLSNFSREYFLLYGEKPSDTLKRNIFNQ